MKRKILIISITIIIAAIAGVVAWQRFFGEKLVACTMEAKICPDGSYVGRTGPKCEFAPCPNTTTSVNGETSSAGSNSAENNNIVTIKDFSFSPPILKIRVGEKVTWKHNDSATHSVIDAIFKSNTLNRGDEFSFVFSAVGEYNYHCGIHPSMKGKIIVE